MITEEEHSDLADSEDLGTSNTGPTPAADDNRNQVLAGEEGIGSRATPKQRTGNTGKSAKPHERVRSTKEQKARLHASEDKLKKKKKEEEIK